MPRKPSSKQKPQKAPKAPSATLAHVHETTEALAGVEMTPPHPPREETPAYARAHHFLVYEKGAPCEVCGVTRRTLRYQRRNPFGAKALETHHFPIERSLLDACDPKKVHADFPQVYDRASLEAFVDSPANLKVLCDVHHRSVEHGIHHLTPADFAVQRYLYDGYLVAATTKDAPQVQAADEALMVKLGLEETPAAATPSAA